MKTALMAVSFLALAVLLLLPVLHMFGAAPVEASRYGMIAGTIVWFVTAPFWMRYRAA